MQKEKGEINFTWEGVALGASAGTACGLLVNVLWFVLYAMEARAGRITDAYWVLVPIFTCLPVVVALGLYGGLVGAIGSTWLKKKMVLKSGEELTQADKRVWARNSWLFGAVAGLVPLVLVDFLDGSLVQNIQQGITVGSGFLSIQFTGLALIPMGAIAARLCYIRLSQGVRISRAQSTPAEEEVGERGVANRV